MIVKARGSSFPIKTFSHPQFKVISIHEAGIFLINPQTGAKFKFEAKRPIIDAASLGDGTIILLDNNSRLSSIKSNSDNELFEIESEILFEPYEILEISSNDRFIIASTSNGLFIIFEYHDQKISMKHVLRPGNKCSGVIFKVGILKLNNLNLAFCYHSNNLEGIILTLYSIEAEGFSKINEISVPGIECVYGNIESFSEDTVDFICFEGDVISKLTYNLVSNAYKTTIFKIKSRTAKNHITLITFAEKYVINDVTCPSFLIFTKSSEVFLGVLLESSIKFWSVACDANNVESALFSEELGLLFLNSRERSGFYSIDTMNLKITIFSHVESMGTFEQVQTSSAIIPEHQSLLCLSLQKNSIYSLTEGVNTRQKYVSDAIFRGITKIWALKNHHLDHCHKYLVLSSESVTLAFNIEDSSLTDVTSLLSVDRNMGTKCFFNLHASSFALHATKERIKVIDLSKIDSANDELVKFEYKNLKEPWDLVVSHNFHLFCVSQLSRSITSFRLKNRPRDVELISPINELSFTDLGIQFDEISVLAISAFDDFINLFICTISGNILKISLDSVCNILSKESIRINSIVESIEVFRIASDCEICFLGTRSGELLKITFENNSNSNVKIEIKTEIVDILPIKLMTCKNDSILAYSCNSAILLTELTKNCIKQKVLDWKCEISIELIHKPGESYIAGIKDDSLIFLSTPPFSESKFSKLSLFYGTTISSFLHLKSKYWLLGHYNNIRDKKNYLSIFSPSGVLINSIDQGSDEVLFLLSNPVSENQIIISILTTDKDKDKDRMIHSKIQIVGLEADKLEIKNEYICEGSISKAKFFKNFIYFSIKEEFFVLEICTFTKKFLNRTSYHFRNFILDFDICEEDHFNILVSCFSDGLDFLKLIKSTETSSSNSNNNNLKLIPDKGDKISRTCIACLWINPNKFIATDKRKNIYLCEISAESRWIKTLISLKFNEIVIKLFIHDTKVYCESITGGIFDISDELL